MTRPAPFLTYDSTATTSHVTATRFGGTMMNDGQTKFVYLVGGGMQVAAGGMGGLITVWK